MADIFDQKIFCRKCDLEMGRVDFVRNGFRLRSLLCEKCGARIIHPADEEEYKKFKELRGKEFKVKMRIVGNSYAISIPKEIVAFMKGRDKKMIGAKVGRVREDIVDDIVRLCFEDARRLSVNFGDFE